MSNNSEILQKIEELRAQLKAEEEKVQLQQEQERFENLLSRLEKAIKRAEGVKELIDHFKQNVVYSKDITFLAHVEQFEIEYRKWKSHEIDRSSLKGIGEARDALRLAKKKGNECLQLIGNMNFILLIWNYDKRFKKLDARLTKIEKG